MEVGYFTMPLHPPGSNITQTLADDLEQIVTLDELGYREAWIGEHFTFAWENIPVPDLFIAQALGMTKNIILGTGVHCMPNHNPMMLAHRVAQLDHMARGRFYWGIGSSSTPGDYEMFGFDPEVSDRRAYTRDALEIILQIWEDPKPGLYESKHWRFRIPEPVDEVGLAFHLKPYTKPHPPIAIAGVSPRSETLIQAGERGWIPMSINLVPSEIIKTHWDAVEEGARNAGRTADRSIWRIAREVYIAETTEQARKEALEGTMGRDFQDYWLRLMPWSKTLDRMKLDPDMPDSDVTPEYLMDALWIVGSPDDVADQLRQLYEEVGGFGVLLAMGHEWQPKDRWVNSMTLLAKEVMPRLADLS
jgi:alkanesulfonate monooxygenase SsuD/methylene tetrahydromethanopterin reductase-like flavin-dependent oxidoreductase (luciferase family)